jgi:hypothetical protein
MDSRFSPPCLPNSPAVSAPLQRDNSLDHMAYIDENRLQTTSVTQLRHSVATRMSFRIRTMAAPSLKQGEIKVSQVAVAWQAIDLPRLLITSWLAVCLAYMYRPNATRLSKKHAHSKHPQFKASSNGISNIRKDGGLGEKGNVI